MWRVLALLLAAGFVVADPPEKKDDKKADSLEGTWAASVTINRGQRIAALAGYETILTLKKDGSYSMVIRNQTIDEGTYKIDAAKNPKEIDTESTKGANKGKKNLGIYELKDDHLKIAFAGAGNKERPDKFEGDTIQVMEFAKKK